MYVGATLTVGSQQVLNPPWVQGGTTSMRLVQKAAERHLPAPRRLPDQPLAGYPKGHAGFEEAPWMGHGGVHHMDPGHMGQCSAACLHAMSCTPDVPTIESLYTAGGANVAVSCLPTLTLHSMH